ncbi:U3 small nucleolar RNA-associated protein 10 [Hondaea fermentalgiana]|uniref:HEAT repeat-containing protein 1 n=1 Tax=Hondaea fermentalgiana TaxID=2315210 RepID=A0A2R5GI43_9STRA|nr:U3 small nucleolar RNA-associated protein 10 [Hondaea fermentalgiana]|eukprot:GBG30566.1 U3 small nucleolar RNA-associated protein 10 [Hondaea fermentalgiana]
MTSLERQLAQTRAAAGTVDRPSRGTRASLLFERHEAADYDRQTIHALGLSGLDALVSAKGADDLAVFRDSLFGKAVSATERELLAPEIEKELDETINKFLQTLSRYVLHKASLKVLEYLVRQFHVHQLNVDALVCCVLPFHDTEIFAKVICLPTAVQNTRWAFLKQLTRTREPLARNHLVKAAVAEPPILAACATMTLRQPEHERVASFFTVLACQCLRRARQRGDEEKLVQVLMAPTVEALRSNHGPDFLQRAGYILGANLARYSALSAKAAKLVILATIRKARKPLLADALRCSAIVLDNQDDLPIPDSSVSRLATHYGADALSAALASAFGESPAAGSADESFVSKLYAQLAADPEGMKTLIACMRVCMPANVQPVFHALAVSEYDSETGRDENCLVAGRLIAAQRGDAIDELLEASSDETLLSFAADCFSGNAALAAHRVVNGVPLRAALHHHKASVRRHALEQLAQGDLVRDTVSIRVLMDRIMDDNCEVSVAALALAAKLHALPSTTPTSSKKGEEAPLEPFIVEAALTACARHSTEPAFAEAFLQWAPVVGPLASLDDFMGLAAALFTLAPAVSKSTPDGKKKRKASKSDASIVTSVLAACAATNKHIALVAPLAEKSLEEVPAFANKLGNWLLNDSFRVSAPHAAAASCVALADAIAETSDADTAELAAKLATVAHVDAELAAKVLERLVQCDALQNEKETSLVREALHGGAKQVPSSMVLLCTLLGASEELYQDACAKSVQTLLTTCFQGVLLQSLLLICAGALPDSVASSVAQRRAIVLATAFIRAMRDPQGKEGFSFCEVTPYLIHPLCHRTDAKLRDVAVDCAQAVMESADFARAYLDSGSKAPEALPNVGPGCSRKRSAAEAFSPLLAKVVDASKEFHVDADSLERCFRTLHSEETFLAILERAACIASAATNADDASGVSVARCVENILRPLGKIPDLGEVFGSTEAAALAAQALEHGMTQVLSLVTHRWTTKKCKLGRLHIDVILKGLSVKSARQIVLHTLSAQQVFALLTAADKDAAFDALCSLVAEEGAGSTLSNEAVTALGRVPFEGKMLEKRLKEDPNRIVLEATRARLFGARGGSVSASDRVDLAADTLPALFAVLRKYDDLLVISCLNCAMQILEAAPGKRANEALMAVDLELVVSCILGAKTTAMRNAALELLATCTKVFPQQTIPVVLPIVRQASQQAEQSEEETGTSGVYHMVILEQVTRCIASSRADFSNAAIMDVLKEFVNASAHSSDPARLLQLQELLVQSCGNKNRVLWAVLLLMLGSANGADAEDRNNMEQQKDLAGQLLARFSVEDQIAAVVEMIQVMHRFLPTGDVGADDDEEDDDADEEEEEQKEESKTHGAAADGNARKGGHAALAAALDFDGTVNAARGVDLVNAICGLISEHLGSKAFMRMLRTLSQAQVNASGLHGSAGFLGLLNALHGQIHRAGRIVSTGDEESAVWSAVRDQLCLILDKLSALLSVPMFVAVVQELLRDGDPHVRQLAIRQLAAKVEQQHARWQTEEVLMFLEMVSDLHEILRERSESDVNKQVALLAVDVLAKHLGAQHPKPFVEVLDSVVKEFRRTSAAINRPNVTTAHIQLTSSACLCVGTLIGVLGERVLKLLPSFGKSMFVCFSQALDLDESPDQDRVVREARALLGQSAATSIHALVSTLPQFLSPYVADVLTVASRGNHNGAPQLVRLTSARIADKVARKMEARIVLGPLTALYASFVEEHRLAAARNLVSIVRASMEGMGRDALVQENARLTAFFVQALDTRRFVGAGCSALTVSQLEEVASEVQTLEETVADAFMDYVLVLSAAQMKQLFNALREQVDSKATALASRAGSLFENLGDDEEEKAAEASSDDDDEEEEDVDDAEEEGARVGSKRKAPSAGKVSHDAASDASDDDDEESEESDEDDDGSEEEDEDEAVLVNPAEDWQRQCAAATLYVFASALGKKLLGLSVPFLEQLVEELKGDLEVGCEDVASAPSGKRTKRNAKQEDWAQVWRFQQRVVRERALEVVGTYCEHRVASSAAAEDSETTNREFVELLDAVLAPLDVDLCALQGVKADETSAESAGADSDEDDDDEDVEMRDERKSTSAGAVDPTGDVAYYEGFVRDCVIPCVVKLAKSVTDDTLWQAVQRSVLEYARHAAGEVRVAALHTIVALFEGVGDSFIVLLADTLPTVAELLEDRDPRVKREAHRTAKKLQQLSGEDLSSFLQ